MKKKILLLISFGAVLALMMEANIDGIKQSALIFLIGLIGIFSSKKEYAWDFSRMNIKSILIITIMMVLVSDFCEKWRYSSMISGLASVLGMKNTWLLATIGMILSVVAYACLYVLEEYGVKIWHKTPGQYRNGYLLFGVTLSINFLPQYMLAISSFEMGLLKYLTGMAIILIFILLLYALTGKYKLSVILSMFLFVGLATANAYIYSFRGIMLAPIDFFSVKTALNVADNYSLWPIPYRIAASWIVTIVVAVIILKTQISGKTKSNWKVRLQSLLLCVCLGTGVFLYAKDLGTNHWYAGGVSMNGYILDFVVNLKELNFSAPEGYHADVISDIQDQYQYEEVLSEEENAEVPHIIVIMDESFADFRVIGDFATNIEVTPYISSLKEDVITGYALASVYGGSTANSEFEFLTGNSMAYLPSGTIPYQQYVNEDSYSVVSHLKENYGYKCIAMHPYNSSGWNRTKVYDYFGFDQWMFIEDFPQENLFREYVSDYEMFEKLIEVYEENKDESLFLFGVTMQNHGGYLYEGDNYEKTITLTDYAGQFPQAEQYLSCIHGTDKAVEMLVEYYKSVEEPVVIVFFGDHLPKVEEEFYEAINGGTFDSVDEMQEKYTVPFFVWANYDMEEKYVECTSLNYLANFMYEAAGISLPAYNQFLEDVQKMVPAMNTNGYYSVDKKGFVSFEAAEGEEADVLKRYEMLQYNALFDVENRSDIFIR